MNIQFDTYAISSLDTSNPKAFFDIINNNRSRLEDFFAGTVSRTMTLKDTEDYCKVIEQRIVDKSYFPFSITEILTNSYVGFIDVKNIDWNIPKAELGYFIDSHYEGKRIVSKALGYVVDYLNATYNIRKLLCRVASQNAGSIAVALKNGFQLEGTIRCDYKTTKGEIVDLNYYGRIFT